MVLVDEASSKWSPSVAKTSEHQLSFQEQRMENKIRIIIKKSTIK